MRNKTLFSQFRLYTATAFRYTLFALNLLLLIGLGMKTAKLWISLPFDFPQILQRFPNEPEFTDIKSAEHQYRFALGFETAVFIIGAYLCYEFLIKTRSIRLNLIAPFAVAFLLLTAESVNFFMPALDKSRTIQVCEKNNLTWNKKTNRCNLMELERRRIEAYRKARGLPPKIK